MLTPNKVAFNNIVRHSFRSVIFFLLAAISSACIFGVGFFNDNISSGIGQVKGRIGADMIAVPSDYNDDAKDALFAGDACTMFFKADPETKISNTEGVAQVSSQLYLETLSLDCCSAAGIQIIAFDPDTDFSVSTWTNKDNVRSLKDGELIAGVSCGLQKGGSITFFDHDFTVADVLDETGMGYDHSIFVSFESAKQITSDEKYSQLFKGKSDLTSMVLINADKNCEIADLSRIINRSLSDVTVYSTDSLVGELKKQAGYFKFSGFVADAFVIILSAVSLFSLITLTFYQRRNRIGSMLSVGISKAKIVKIFFFEYLYLTLAGTFAGIGITAVLLLPMHDLIKRSVELPYRFIGAEKTIGLCLTVLAVNLIILIAAYSFTFFKIMRTEPAILMEEQP
ncbi:MAG: ABC transporter permease [Ruminococcus sp.]|uniref:ABC transporter permease n=1 Tax=Ruminococcus sp. TaxID=41978 RepID=UPI0025F74A1C|nr:ABC transporter permease [Ruminococcus sp.]MCR5600374.1 ABC transporter permease [Ruminococcus sp.]